MLVLFFSIGCSLPYGIKSISGKTVDRMNIAAWPATITADGSIYELKTSTKEYVQVNLESDVSKSNRVAIKVYEKRNGYNRYLDCTATLTRKGYTSPYNVLTQYSGSVEENVTDTYISLSDVKQGFYNLTIDFDDTYTGDYPDIDGVPLPVIIDDDNEIIIELDPVNITYSITIVPVTAGGSEITPDNNILGANPSYGWEKISVGVTVGGVNLVDKGIPVNVDTSTLPANKALVTFTYGKTTKGLVLTQSVKCFNPEDKLTVTNSVGKSSTKYEGILKIHRMEDEANSTSQHTGGGNWKWMKNTSQHYQECYRCKYDRFFANHYVEKTINGTYKYNKYSIYSTSGAKTGNDIVVNTQHYKHCTVCNMYDETQDCSGGTWTYEYNAYVNGSRHGCGNGYALTSNSNISTSSSYHYIYCSSCHGRYVADVHHLGAAEEKGDCVTKGKNYCDDNCGYYEEIPALGHEGIEYWNYTSTFSACVHKNIHYRCIRCGINTKKDATITYIDHADDVEDDDCGAYSCPCGGLYFRHQYHKENYLHGHGHACHSAKYQITGFLRGADANYKGVNANSWPIGEYLSDKEEWGFWRSGTDEFYHSGSGETKRRTDGLRGVIMYYWKSYEEINKKTGKLEKGWHVWSQRARRPGTNEFLSNGMLFFSGKEEEWGVNSNGGVDDKYTFADRGSPNNNKAEAFYISDASKEEYENKLKVDSITGYSSWVRNPKVNDGKSNAGSCKVAICCRQFQWPTDASKGWESEDDKTFVYLDSNGRKTGRWLYCFGLTAYGRYLPHK